ncbi:MAG: hypothetical protein MST10_03420 [Lentisphaeria bacterium]|nr:hypothetical protein [Lentisphaeria bacterium]
MKKKCLSSSALLIAIAALCSVNSGCKSPDNNREIVGGIKKIQDEMNREKLPESHLENIQAYALNQLGDDQNEINLIEKKLPEFKKSPDGLLYAFFWKVGNVQEPYYIEVLTTQMFTPIGMTRVKNIKFPQP